MALEHFKHLLNEESPIPLYYQAAQALISYINGHGISIEERFPSEEKICQEWSLSRPTVAKAMRLLMEKGYLKRRGRKGSFLDIQPKLPIAIDAERFFFAISLAKSGIETQIKVLSKEIINPVPDINSKLLAPEDEKLIYIRRIRYHEDTVLFLNEDYLRFSKFKKLLEVENEEEFDLLYKLIKKTFNEKTARIQRELTAARMTADVADHFEADFWDPCLLIKGRGYNFDNDVISYFETTINTTVCTVNINIEAKGE